MSECLCGCGGTPQKGQFMPGHDSIAVWKVIREKYGDSVRFVLAHRDGGDHRG